MPDNTPSDEARSRPLVEAQASLERVRVSTDRLKGSAGQAKNAASKVKEDTASMKDTASEAVGMVVAYAKQETLDPIKALGRYVLWGFIGALFIGTGAFLLALGAIRAIQAEFVPHLTGNLTWVPYVAGILIGLIGAALALSRIGKVPKR